ncbi:MAG: PD-(D/E)XK nuclease family protein, partial [Clostridia bacterium]|nr:PD-(D/E)XK nuclease family protein [Clostridia bacterium]
VGSALDTALFSSDGSARLAIASLAGEFPALARAGSLTAPLSADGDRIPASGISEMFPGGLSLTQARIDKFSECPFSYYTRYVLGIEERPKSSLDGVDAGNLVHRILEMFFKKTAGRDYPIPEDETEDVVDGITEEYISEIFGGNAASAKRRYLFRRLRRTTLVLVRALMEEFSETSFEPYRFELKLGDSDDTPSPLVFTATDGTKVSLYGTIDRVDRFEKDGHVYVRVVDYKTYKKTFRLEDIQKGINLQLLIYLFTLWKGKDGAFRRELSHGGDVLPAGMFYLSQDPNGASAPRAPSPEDAFALASKEIKRSGLYLNDADSLAAMGMAPGMKGAPRKIANLATLEEMGKIYEDIKEVIKGISDGIRSGKCSSSPVFRDNDGKLPCERCGMRPVCRHIEERGEERE